MDNDRLRLISIASESASPKIYDQAQLTLAGDYVSGTTDTLIDAVYDESTEILDGGTAVPGSGTLYYVTSNKEVHKWKATSVAAGVVASAGDTSYNFTGTTLAGTVRVALTPAGLLVTQPNKNRILRVTP